MYQCSRKTSSQKNLPHSARQEKVHPLRRWNYFFYQKVRGMTGIIHHLWSGTAGRAWKHVFCAFLTLIPHCWPVQKNQVPNVWKITIIGTYWIQLQAMQLVTDKDLMESAFALSVPKCSPYVGNGGAALTIQIKRRFAGNSACNLHASHTSWPWRDYILDTKGCLLQGPSYSLTHKYMHNRSIRGH